MPRILRCNPALFEKDLSGRTYIITGANSGCGLAVTQQLVRQGAVVVAACRRVAAAEQALAHLDGEKGSVEVMRVDLNSLASVRAFVTTFENSHDHLHGLVNNAGVMHVRRGRTEDGFERHIGVNHLAHFLLTELLLPRLKASAPSRVVCVSSVAHFGMLNRRGTIDVDDLHFDRRPYDRFSAYNQSKPAIVIYARHLAGRLEGTGVSAFSTHPGWVRSNLVKHTVPTWVQNGLMKPLSGLLGMMSAEDGAQTQLHCLLDDDAPDHSGAYYSQISIFYSNKKDKAGGWPMRSPNPMVYDDTLAERLCTTSAELVGLKSRQPQG